jgi:hypothetical protein
MLPRSWFTIICGLESSICAIPDIAGNLFLVPHSPPRVFLNNLCRRYPAVPFRLDLLLLQNHVLLTANRVGHGGADVRPDCSAHVNKRHVSLIGFGMKRQLLGVARVKPKGGHQHE